MARLLAATLFLFALISCAAINAPEDDGGQRLRATVALVDEVKVFERSLGIEPTESLRRSARDQSLLSMLWLWMQREGTLALRGPVDIRMAIGFHAHKEQIPLERVYGVEGYSVYYRQGNEFADERAVATVGFAAEGIVRRVKVILHEDLHGDDNFDLPWEIEESIVTPLGSLAAVEFFRRKGDSQNLERALAGVEEERKMSRELNGFVAEAQKLFTIEALEEAKKKILALMPSHPSYYDQFRRQTAGQNSSTVLEAKLSHDLAYFRYFDAIATLFDKAPDLKTLIADLKRLPRDTSNDGLEKYLQELHSTYGAPRR